jgi:hypothetical protein
MLDRMSAHLTSYVREVREFKVEITKSDYPERA